MTERRHGIHHRFLEFFTGSGKAIVLMILTAALVMFANTFIRVPLPSDYVSQSLYNKEIRDLQDNKVSRSIYEADQRALDRRLMSLEKGQNDLINLHLFPEQTRRRLMREKSGG